MKNLKDFKESENEMDAVFLVFALLLGAFIGSLVTLAILTT